MDRELIERAIAKQRGVPYLPPAMPGDAPYIPGGAPADVPLVAPEPLPAAPPVVPPALDPGAPAPAPVAAPATAAPVEPPAPWPEPMPSDAPLTLPQTGGSGLADSVQSLEALTDVQAEATLRQGKEEQRAALRNARASRSWADEANELSTQYDSKDAAADAMYRQTIEQFRKLTEDAAALPPARDRRSRGQQIFGALVGIVGGKDVTDMINTMVERDIAGQQSEIDSKRQAAANKLTELGIARQYIGDVRESTRFAAALRKERFAGEVEAAASELSSKTARNKATFAAAQIKVEAQKEKLDVLKKVMSGKLTATEAAMLVKLGVLTPAQAAAQLATTVDLTGKQDPRGPAPSDSIVGPVTKPHASAVNVEGMRAASIPGLELTQDPAMYPAEVVKTAREYKTKSDQFIVGTQILKEYWTRAADPNLPDEERRKALTDYRRYRGDLIAKMSIKNDQGVVTNPEMAQRVETMPSPAYNMIQQGKQAWDEFFNATYYGADMFDRVINEAEREALVTYANYGYRPRSSSSSAATPEPTPTPTGAKGRKTPPTPPAKGGGNLDHLFK